MKNKLFFLPTPDSTPKQNITTNKILKPGAYFGVTRTRKAQPSAARDPCPHQARPAAKGKDSDFGLPSQQHLNK